MEKVKKYDEIKWSKKDIPLFIFVLIVMILPIAIDSISKVLSWLLDFILITTSVIAAKDVVFKDHYENKYQFWLMCAITVFIMLIYEIVCLNCFKEVKNIWEAMSLGLNYTIRMLSLFILFYHFYYEKIKKGKISNK